MVGTEMFKTFGSTEKQEVHEASYFISLNEKAMQAVGKDQLAVA